MIRLSFYKFFKLAVELMNWSQIFSIENIVGNLLSDTLFFIITLPIAIALLPDLTIRLIKKSNSRYLTLKLGAVLRELCDFLGNSPFRDSELNDRYLSVSTRRKNIKNFRHVAMSCINVMNPIVFPKIFIVVGEQLERMAIHEKYKIVQAEFKRLSLLRQELERILSAHSLYLDEDLVLQTSLLCTEIRKSEIMFKENVNYNELLDSTKSERTIVFGVFELPKIYQEILKLTKAVVEHKYFEHEIIRP
jgi:hypothetical protein